ncbi:MAG: type IV secretory system conjugative DNA transfer family protein, partial [Muribaculaceae bacterium]|nr:type IV secretory system conjugative DNA transfer family protein [Muribaculaceae bacterium]
CSAMIAERMWSSIVEFANRALEPFDFEEARTIFENPKSFDISKLGTEKTALFLNVSDTDRTFDNLINVFYTQALQILCSFADSNICGRLKVPVRIIMDDFAASGNIPDFDKIISTIRSRDISVSLILQSMTQLESMYSPAEATTIVNNCDHIIYLGSQDLETANFIGNRIFKTPDEVLCIPRDKAVVITTGEKAVIADKIKPYSTLKS